MGKPRSRAELETMFEQRRILHEPIFERYRALAAFEEECRELRQLVIGLERDNTTLEWELFRRLQLDGVLPSLPRVRAPANTNHKNDNESENDDGDERSSSEAAG